MPRNGSGTYTLPTGNPVSPGTTIESAWANTTLSDIGTELTNSLSRTGAGGMLAAFRLADGTLAAPGVAFLNETGTGLYRAGSGEMWNAVQGIQIQQYTVNGVLIPTGKTFTAQGDSTLANLAYTGTLTGGTGVVALGTNQFYKDASGNVGIGTATPANKLSVVASSNTTDDNTITLGFALNTTSQALASIGTTNVDSANGGIKFSTATAGVLTEKATIDAAGNLGLGVVPSAWNSAERALDIGDTGALVRGGSAQLRLMYNAYVNASSQYIYKITGTASQYQQTAGQHEWYTAPSGTAGNAITFTQAMTLDASGRLLFGSVSGLGQTQRVQADGDYLSYGDSKGLRLLNTATNGGGGIYSNTGTAGGITIGSDGGPMVFSAGGGEAARFNTSKNLLVGTTSGIGRVVTNSGAAGNTSHGFGIVGLGNTNGATGGFFSVRMVTINGDGGTSSGNTFVSNVYGTKGVCIAAFDSSGNSVSPSTAVSNSNLCTFVAIVSI